MKSNNKTNSQKRTRLMILRFIGIGLILFSAYIVWINISREQSSKFWSFNFKPKENIYSLPGKWLDQDNKSLSNSDFKGKVTVLSFLYLKCKESCPRLIHDLILLDQLNQSNNKNLQFIVFLLDESKASPKDLKAYVKKYNIDKPYWHILTGSPEDIKQLTKVFKVAYTVADEKSKKYIHSNLIAVVDPNGKVIEANFSFREKIKNIQKSIEKTILAHKENKIAESVEK